MVLTLLRMKLRRVERFQKMRKKVRKKTKNARKCARKIHGRAQKERKTAGVIGGCKIGWVKDKSG